MEVFRRNAQPHGPPMLENRGVWGFLTNKHLAFGRQPRHCLLHYVRDYYLLSSCASYIKTAYASTSERKTWFHY